MVHSVYTNLRPGFILLFCHCACC